MARTHNDRPEYVKLEQRLILLAWLNDLFGYKDNSDLLTDIREASEGFDSNGRSYLYHHLVARGGKIKIERQDLLSYDDNIRLHLEAMNAGRPKPITLRCFQHLAVLYTEVFLDIYFNARSTLVAALNAFLKVYNSQKGFGVPETNLFNQSDLTKLAYWMATGSGKTLIMHFNYRQFLHYNNMPLDNILLITPKEDLSEQHIDEMIASNIPCRRFDLNESGLMLAEPGTVRVIEITKLVEVKRGGGLSVPIEAFEGNNLIFVDEGHKGSGGEAWRSFRDALGTTGFTFEYSATFGQALTAARDDELTSEYGKAIVFDYSYHYFHGDGYGKDFRILNLREETDENRTDMLILGNLLSFYEQTRFFEDSADTLKNYNLDKPLWVFVGSSVNAVYTENKEKRSDVLRIARFLHRVLQNTDGWVIETIKKLLSGDTGLHYPDGHDIFKGKYNYLTEIKIDAKTVYQEILLKVMHTHTGGGLHICDLHGSPGELGLKAGDADDYFGLIYIGDTNAFKKLVETDNSGITLTDDTFTSSLFKDINNTKTSIEILIGAKKFMEGWSSWRVSNMGLLNIGRKEGAEIIQLFGRGVRLRGKDFLLKRSSALDGSHPAHLPLLETLNIFAVRADYMTQFREYLEKEGIETESSLEFPLKICPNADFLNKGLVVPRIPDGLNFTDEEAILLDIDPEIKVRVDMSLKLRVIESRKPEGSSLGFSTANVQDGQESIIPEKILNLIDWEQIYLSLLEYKERKGLHNLIVRAQFPRVFFEHSNPGALYSVVAGEALTRPTSFASLSILQELVLTVLQGYTDKFYRLKRERWESKQMIYENIVKEDANFQDYTVKVVRREADLIEEIKTLIDEEDRIYREDLSELPSIYFDRHLYQPLLVEHDAKVRSSPPGLKKSEQQFVKDLRSYCHTMIQANLAETEVYLLRNLSRGKGIGFFEKRGFYPDFILWIKTADLQRIVFIEPHGMLHAEAYQHDEKAKLHETLPYLASEIKQRTKWEGIELDSYIVSATPLKELQTRYDDGSWGCKMFMEKHILFPVRKDDYDYIEIIMRQK